MSSKEFRRALALSVIAVAVAGCGGGGGDGGSGGDEASSAGAAVASPVDAATAGTIAGSVMFTGMAPSLATIDMSEESVCADKHSEPPTSQEVLVSEDGGLANVFVYVKEGLEGMTFPTPSQAVVMDQNGCRYLPHVLGAQVGQDITLKNSDGVLHNINATPTENRGFNRSQPVVMETNVSFRTAEVMIPVRCDVHGWMSSYIGVLDHPFHSVSDMGGGFSLETLPPGEYVVEAWHEQYGTQTQTVTVVTGETVNLEFTFNAEMAGNPVPMGEPLVVAHLDHEASVAGGR